ncbi:MAG TPA: VWA domain-containing protein [Blastocatellia bacterium]|nr:VWA domain-containing protein [Blastocatellia bacterium]
MLSEPGKILLATLIPVILAAEVWAAVPQAGRRSPLERSGASVIVNVIVEQAPGGKDFQLTRDRVELYDAGIPQQIESLTPDYSAARIVLLIDSSESLKLDGERVLQIVKDFAASLYEGDEMMLVGYNETAEVFEDFTADRTKLELAATRFKKERSPKMWDALQATLDDALRQQVGHSKRIIILVSDGFDRESVMPAEDVLAHLARENVVVYALQLEDRTRGAARRKALKPEEALRLLTERTGGKIYPIKEEARAAREILEEVSDRWYQLVYKPQGINPLNTRRILLIPNDPKVKLRTKLLHPGEKY